MPIAVSMNRALQVIATLRIERRPLQKQKGQGNPSAPCPPPAQIDVAVRTKPPLLDRTMLCCV
jgi:hypothetical protein